MKTIPRLEVETGQNYRHPNRNAESTEQGEKNVQTVVV